MMWDVCTAKVFAKLSGNIDFLASTVARMTPLSAVASLPAPPSVAATAAQCIGHEIDETVGSKAMEAIALCA